MYGNALKTYCMCREKSKTVRKNLKSTVLIIKTAVLIL